MIDVLEQNHDAPAEDRPALHVGRHAPRISAADAARTIVDAGGPATSEAGGSATSDAGGSATLSTLAVSPPGHPFGSIVSFAVDGRGDPLFFISELAEHTRNLRADGRASLLATETAPSGVDPLALGRVTLLGVAHPVPEERRDEARSLVVARHPAVAVYADYGDFSAWRLEVATVRWVGGFGRMTWIDADDYAAADPDPVSGARHGIAEHMNADHADAGVLLCQQALDEAGHGEAIVSAATFDSVDRYGCDYVATTTAGSAYVRLAFDEPATSLDEVRRAMVALVHRARRHRPAAGTATVASR